MKTSTPNISGSRKATVISLLFCGSLLLLFSGLLLQIRLDFFWTDDYQLEYLPVYLTMGEAVSGGEFPLLTTRSWVSGNIAGEYQYGLFSFYVLFCAWLSWIVPISLPLKGALFSVMHLLPLALGACLLARKRSLNPSLSVTVGIVAACNGWIIAWGATNWIPALVAFAWVPWFWFAAEKCLEKPRSLSRAAVTGLFLYLVLTGGWPHTIFMVVILSAWLVLRRIGQAGATRALFSFAVAWTLGIALAAPALWSFVEYAGSSARSPFGSIRQEAWAVPASAFWGLLNPSFRDYWIAYRPPAVPMQCLELASGFIPVVALLTALLWFHRWNREQRWDLLLLMMTGLLSMSSSIGPFRWNFRWLPFFHLVLGLLSCSLIQNLRWGTDKRRSLPIGIGAPVITGILVLVAVLFLGDRGPLPWQEYFELLLFSVILLVIHHGKGRTQRFSEYVLPSVVFVSLFSVFSRIPTDRMVPRFPFPSQITDPGPLDTKRLYLSVYELPHTRAEKEQTPPHYWLLARPGNSHLYSGLSFVNGYSPLFPPGISQLFRFSFNGSIHPETGRYLIKMESANGRLLDLLGIDGLVFSPHSSSMAEGLNNDWRLVARNSSGLAYERKRSPSRFSIIGNTESGQPAKINPDGFVLVGEDDRRVVLKVIRTAENVTILYSRPYFSGYKASLNGKPLSVRTFQSAIPAVHVPAGSEGILELEYTPGSYYTGRILSGLAVLAIFLFLLLQASQSNFRRPGKDQ